MLTPVEAVTAADVTMTLNRLEWHEEAAIHNAGSESVPHSDVQSFVAELVSYLESISPPAELPQYSHLLQLAARIPTWGMDEIAESIEGGIKTLESLARRLGSDPNVEVFASVVTEDTAEVVRRAYRDASLRCVSAVRTFRTQLAAAQKINADNAVKNDAEWERSMVRSTTYRVSAEAEAKLIREAAKKPEEHTPSDALVGLFRNGH
jgi:hypothetical protein